MHNLRYVRRPSEASDSVSITAKSRARLNVVLQ
nr:MAG TPA: hypothetical protein [Caudoviricetes sp.]